MPSPTWHTNYMNNEHIDLINEADPEADNEESVETPDYDPF